MEEFKNSFYKVATHIANSSVKTAKSQMVMIDNYTQDAPILRNLPFQRSSHNYHHAYGDVLDVQGMQIVDFDAPLPMMHVGSQYKSINLTPFGGAIEFGEDMMLQTYGTPEAYLGAKIPALLRESGARLETSLYINNFIPMAVKNNTALSAIENPVSGNKYETMVAITWTPDEMTGLYSPLPYGAGEHFGQLFKPEWANGKQRHLLRNGAYGYAATVKMLIGILLANKRKISALVNIEGTPTAKQLANLVTSAQGNGNTRIYCSSGLRTSIAAAYARTMDGSGLVSVSGVGEVSILGIPIVTSHNIPSHIGAIEGQPFSKPS